MIGIFAEVYLVNGVTIRKIPRGRSQDEMQPIIREATIYSIMDSHPRLARCISRGQTDLVEVEYYPNGDLLGFCQRRKISGELQSKWFQQIIEAVVVIHQYGVIHSDLALRQFFVDDELIYILVISTHRNILDILRLGMKKQHIACQETTSNLTR